jgi:hypothetical protein
MKKQQLFLSSFAKLFLLRARTTFRRKSFLVFLLAFAALILGRSQEVMGQWDFDWGVFPPGLSTEVRLFSTHVPKAKEVTL